MIKLLDVTIEKKRSNSPKSELNKYIIDKNQITDYPKSSWFKGSRHR